MRNTADVGRSIGPLYTPSPPPPVTGRRHATPPPVMNYFVSSLVIEDRFPVSIPILIALIQPIAAVSEPAIYVH